MRTSKQNTFVRGLVDVNSNAVIQNMFVKSSAIEARVAAAEKPSSMKFRAVAAGQFFNHLQHVVHSRLLANINAIGPRNVGTLRSNINATWMILVPSVHIWYRRHVCVENLCSRTSHVGQIA